jgi:putative hydrolase of the HAD superfamily
MFSNLAGIIFDLDDTIYNYTECHDAALRTCITFLCEKTEIGFDTILQQYNKIAKQLKDELPGVASSHNKSIYFKQLLENLGLSYTHFIHINDLYWRTFYDNIRPFDGVREYIEWNRKLGIKIGVLTDYETEYQIIKLEKLGLLELVDHIVTSEEIGIEKPSRRAFLTILDQMKLRPEDVCMIGDNYKKDICGASELGIRGLLF